MWPTGLPGHTTPGPISLPLVVISTISVLLLESRKGTEAPCRPLRKTVLLHIRETVSDTFFKLGRTRIPGSSASSRTLVYLQRECVFRGRSRESLPAGYFQHRLREPVKCIPGGSHIPQSESLAGYRKCNGIPVPPAVLGFIPHFAS